MVCALAFKPDGNTLTVACGTEVRILDTSKPAGSKPKSNTPKE